MINSGFSFKGIESSEYKITMKTVDIPLKPNKRTKKIYTLGRNKPYTYDDGYDRKQITLRCEINALSIEERRSIARYIGAWLDGEGDLILNYESNKVYNAVVDSVVPCGINNSYDQFTVRFEVDLAKSTFYNEDITWGDAELFWNEAELTWDGAGTDRVFTSAGTYNLKNLGTFVASPIISLTGTSSSVTISVGDLSFTYTDLDGTVYIDTENKLVYSGTTTKVNERSNFSGDYPLLESGDNEVIISENITVEFDFKNTYL